ncbi:MAG: molecular chaperone HtpG [Deltaproteobacteria bacterium]|nr:MAG: molecular chaperone HtpG [Deltaproteobacteria bacterium]
MAEKNTYEFKTEVKQLLNLIVNSLYSNQEIFLRELVSNASDAIDKLNFKAQTDDSVLEGNDDFFIRIEGDKAGKKLVVSDNGIGMTREEIEENIGTIAKSGTSAFAEALEKSKKEGSLSSEFIGQFGVGFYSAFMVAKKVTLVTKSAGSDEAWKWESEGDGKYIIEKTEKEFRGTDVIVELKEPEDGENDYTDEYTLRRIIKKHSDFIRYPVVMKVESNEPIPEDQIIKDADGKPIGETTRRVIKDETLNSMKAIWTKNKSEVSDKEYEEFYRHISHNWDSPLDRIHMKFEGTTEYSILLFIPSKAPFDLFREDRKNGLNLYCKKVFIMDDCKELIPEYLGFVEGVVDAPDLNLNVSREILQQDRLVRNIRKNIVKKVLELLKNMDFEKYETFFKEFGPVLKAGVPMDPENKDKVADLLRYETTDSDGKLVSFSEYVENMKEDQKDIYYLTGENISSLKNSPYLEALREKGYEVLLMVDPVDEWVVQGLPEYSGKKLKSAEKGDLDLDNEGNEENEKQDKPEEKDYKFFFDFIKKELEDKIGTVKSSSRLRGSVSCLSSEDSGMSAYMEKILKASGQEMPVPKRILELNTEHEVVKNMKSLFEKDPGSQKLKDYITLIYDLAVIGEGGKIENPALFSRLVGELMLNSI